jgi:hypothetical protein
MVCVNFLVGEVFVGDYVVVAAVSTKPFVYKGVLIDTVVDDVTGGTGNHC